MLLIYWGDIFTTQSFIWKLKKSTHSSIISVYRKQGYSQQPGTRQIARLIAFFPCLLCFQKWEYQSESKIWLCFVYWVIFCTLNCSNWEAKQGQRKAWHIPSPKNLTRWPWPLTLKIKRIPDVTKGLTDDSISISLRNFIGEGIIKGGNILPENKAYAIWWQVTGKLLIVLLSLKH